MNQALIVLGMHRSGTSAVAGALAKLGAAAPANLMPEHPDNPKGYWESEPLAQLNDQILEAAGSSWHDWRPISDAWFETDLAKTLSKEAARALRLEFPVDGPIVLKDPRICRLMPLWREALVQAGYEPVIATPLRRPLEVASSLAKRDDFSMGRAYLIWLRHVLEAERTTRDLPRVIFRWSDFMRDWRGVMSRLDVEADSRLPVRTPQAEADVDTFLDTDLRRHKHQTAVSPDAPEWIAKAFDALTRLAEDPADVTPRSILDQVRNDFDRTAAIYGPIFDGVEVEYHRFQTRFEHKLADVAQRAEDASKLAQKAELARVETEAGWAAERRAREVLLTEMEGLRDQHRQLVKALQTTEKARLDTEEGWAAERTAKAALATELAFQKTDKVRITSALLASEKAVAATKAAARDHAQRLEALLATEAALEQEIVRLDTLRTEAERRGRDLSFELDSARCEIVLKSNETEAARTELRNLVVRRRRQPVQTAWAILRGRDG